MLLAAIVIGLLLAAFAAWMSLRWVSDWYGDW